MCGSKTPIPMTKMFVSGKVLCDECMSKYGFNKTNTTEKEWKAGWNEALNPAIAVILDMENQSSKADAGKPNLSLVPKQIIYEIEKVRQFGVAKYKEPDNWKKVELERYHQALLRHTLAIWNNIQARDKESGLLHLSHMATNIAFILELMNEEKKGEF
jgi:hypothetical protein